MSAPKLGIITGIDGGECVVRLRNRADELHTMLAVCTPVTMYGETTKMARLGKSATHFMSIEVRGIQSVDKIKKLQKDLGKPCKEETLHITMGVMNVEDTEIKKKFSILVDMFRDKKVG